jgi:ribosomal protein S18 acetylase RimI-like enzyme
MNDSTDSYQKFDSPNWLNQINIRYLTFEDLPKLEWNGEYTHLRQVYLKAYKSRKEGKSVIWVADLLEKGVIGQVFVQLNAIRKDLADGFSCAYIYSFRIKSEFRNYGLGKQMLVVVEKDLRKRRFREVTLNVAKTNINAIRFYKNNGFEISGSEPGEWSYRDHNDKLQKIVEPAWKMIKNIWVNDLS